MTIDVLNREAFEVKGRSSAYRDNILPDLAAWSERGERCALVTLVGVDGNAPRAEGAQMAVSETGQWAGYISGGCLEQAIALEAVQAIKAGKPRLLRYGKGSPYFDIQLPCGSGLDVLVEPFENRKPHSGHARAGWSAASLSRSGSILRAVRPASKPLPLTAGARNRIPKARSSCGSTRRLRGASS